MKKELLLLLLFVSFSGFSQAEKDSLLAKDIIEVYEKLKLMHYLEREVMEYYFMSEDEKVLSDKTFPYYLKKRIVANNPTSIDVLRYLEIYVQKEIPTEWNSFKTIVNNANAKSLLTITEKYGYPSNKRIEKYAGIYDFPNPNIIFSIRKNKYAVELDKMLRKQIRKGNATQGEYDFFLSLGAGQRDVFSANEVGRQKTISTELERQ